MQQAQRLCWGYFGHCWGERARGCTWGRSAQSALGGTQVGHFEAQLFWALRPLVSIGQRIAGVEPRWDHSTDMLDLPDVPAAVSRLCDLPFGHCHDTGLLLPALPGMSVAQERLLGNLALLRLCLCNHKFFSDALSSCHSRHLYLG